MKDVVVEITGRDQEVLTPAVSRIPVVDWSNNADSYQTRLYTKARILGHKRGKRNTRPNQSLVAIEGVDSTEAAKHYLGKVCIRL
jgi:hypothetical protein